MTHNHTHDDDDIFENMYESAGSVTVPDDFAPPQPSKYEQSKMAIDAATAYEIMQENNRDAFHLMNFSGPTLPADFKPPKAEKKPKPVTLKGPTYM